MTAFTEGASCVAGFIRVECWNGWCGGAHQCSICRDDCAKVVLNDGTANAERRAGRMEIDREHMHILVSIVLLSCADSRIMMFCRSTPDVVVRETDIESASEHLRRVEPGPPSPLTWDRKRFLIQLRGTVGLHLTLNMATAYPLLPACLPLLTNLISTIRSEMILTNGWSSAYTFALGAPTSLD